MTKIQRKWNLNKFSTKGRAIEATHFIWNKTNTTKNGHANRTIFRGQKKKSNSTCRNQILYQWCFSELQIKLAWYSGVLRGDFGFRKTKNCQKAMMFSKHKIYSKLLTRIDTQWVVSKGIYYKTLWLKSIFPFRVESVQDQRLPVFFIFSRTFNFFPEWLTA